MLPLPVVALIVPVIATLAGGVTAMRLSRMRPLLVAVGAGLLLGAAFLDLLPEAITLGGQVGLAVADVLGWTLLFFLGFALLETGLDLFARRESDGSGSRATGAGRTPGRVAGGLLIFHSFRDGMAIGAAFAASHAAGYAVATGIAAHDFGDGMNTVLLTTGGKKADYSDYLFLLADALAPLCGGLLTVWWILSSRHAAVLLAGAAGFFLQMATGDFLPQLKAEPMRRPLLIFGVVSGAGLIYGANVLLRWRTLSR